MTRVSTRTRSGYPTNTDPMQPWNDPMKKDDIFAPWNHPTQKSDPFACWNDPFGRGQYEEEVEEYTGKSIW